MTNLILELLSVILPLAAGYVYAYQRYAPIIRDLKSQISKLQWLAHDLRNERDALKTKLELNPVSCDSAPPTEQPADDLLPVEYDLISALKFVTDHTDPDHKPLGYKDLTEAGSNGAPKTKN